ncbi:MAG: cysteine desulfurase [Haliscomenobacteraceae bacterium CHB4]|nr:Cysteine desulfurase SufS [Saprospiraceae bacterium]MCE7922009.1 cysteine desulfurase [Haliscomenobacteraceae bacterium CHB4]
MNPVPFRHEFPIFQRHPDLVYLDSAATTQKPETVIEAERYFYEHLNANVHRGAYRLADEATTAYEAVREKMRVLLNVRDASEIIFTSGTTAGINLVAHCFAAVQISEGDAVVVSAMEHHANLIPWQQVCLRNKAKLLVVPVSPDGVLDMAEYENLLANEKVQVKMVAISHVSNALGTINPIESIVRLAQRHGAAVLVDAAQSIASHTLDVQALDLDFLVFSGHKMFGPTGTGVLYGKEKWLDAMPPWQFGGSMIRDVTFERTLFAPPPQKFEAGTPNLAGVAGLGAAVDWIQKTGRETIARHMRSLLEYATHRLNTVPGLRIIGQAPEKSGIISFLLDGIHPHDLSTFLDQSQICIRAGHHCAQPLMDLLEIPGTVRASFSIYNSEAEIDRLVEALHTAREFFGDI